MTQPRARRASVRRRLAADFWPTVGEEAAVLATMRGDAIDVDWLGKTLRGEEIGGWIPEGHPNSMFVWEAVEYYSWGLSLLEVGNEIGLSMRHVLYYLNHAGVPTRPPFKPRPPAPWWLPAQYRRFFPSERGKRPPATRPGVTTTPRSEGIPLHLSKKRRASDESPAAPLRPRLDSVGASSVRRDADVVVRARARA